MQLDDLIQQERIDNIEKRTRISKVVLNKLQHREFYTLKKPQVIGAIGIIEREYPEYDLDFRALREECNNYFASNQSDDNRFVVLEPENENHVIPKLVVLLLLFLLIYSAWYFFASYYKPVTHEMKPKNEKTFMDIIIEGKDTIMDKVGGASPQATTAEVEVVEVTHQVQENSVVVEPETLQKDISEKESSKGQATAQENTANTVVEVVAKPVVVEKEPIAVVAQEPAQVSAIEEGNMKENEVTAKVKKSDVPQNPLSAKRQKITLLPQKMMWFQLTNIESKKVLKFKRKEQYDINVKGSSWVFHSKDTIFAFIDNDIFEEYGGEGDIFFRLDEDGIHPLTKDEYKTALK